MTHSSRRLSAGRQVLGLIAWLALSFATGAVGAIASMDARTFYAQLTLPTWAPPGWVFGPVWTFLFAIMGIAAWLIWRLGGFVAARVALTLFLAQLVINALWSWLFFAWHQGGLAFVDIVALLCLLVACCVTFWRRSALAATLWVPYVVWVAFATALTLSVWQLNPLSLT